MITIDGSMGEGGGQILRTALSASMITGKPFHIERIRGGRRRPGLLHQHLTAVRAAGEISGATTEGGELGSQSLTFHPEAIQRGSYHFATGTAGSTGLILQTLLVPLLGCGGESELFIEGGTHNEGAPPFEFLDLAFSPVLRMMGADFGLSLLRPGFYPAGGGRIRAVIRGAAWRPLELRTRGSVVDVWARALVARLPISIAERELALVGDRLEWPRDRLTAVTVEANGPGNVVLATVESENITEVFTGFGRRGLPAEEVATKTIDQIQDYLDANVPVGPHLADQLLLPLARSGGGCFLTFEPTAHFRTNMDVLGHFFDVEVTTDFIGERGVLVACRRG
ncbi:MAG: RNA 3'-terminal phosphate cyclase [Actinomycetota bacterium]